MLIKCSSCGAQAKLPDSKEGAKVKCPSCGHIYVARPIGARGSSARGSKDNSSAMIIGGVVVFGAALIGIIASNSGGEEPPALAQEEEVVEEKKEFVDPDGWKGDAVLLTRSLHKAAFTGNDSKLASRLDAEAAYNYVPVEETKGETLAPPPAPTPESGAEGDAPVETAEVEAPAEKKPWSQLTELERIEFADGLVAQAMLAGGDGAVAGWDPFDGMVKFGEEDIRVVRLTVSARDKDAGLSDRYTQWTLKNKGGAYGSADQWRWINVERWVTPEEAAESRRRRKPKAQKKQLSDGSVVYEDDVQEISFDDDVSAEERARLQKLADDLVADVDARPGVRTEISGQLREDGRNAIPALLTTMARLAEELTDDPEADHETMIKLNWVHMELREITGHETTFQVSTVMGATKERIESGLKQWYGWYRRKYKRFELREESGDPLLDDPDWQPRTEEEKRLVEKARHEAEMEKRREEAKKKKSDG